MGTDFLLVWLYPISQYYPAKEWDRHTPEMTISLFNFKLTSLHLCSTLQTISSWSFPFFHNLQLSIICNAKYISHIIKNFIDFLLKHIGSWGNSDTSSTPRGVIISWHCSLSSSSWNGFCSTYATHCGSAWYSLLFVFSCKENVPLKHPKPLQHPQILCVFAVLIQDFSFCSSNCWDLQ